MSMSWKRFPPHGTLLVPLDSRRAAVTTFHAQAPCRPMARVLNKSVTTWVRLFGARTLPGHSEPWQAPMSDDAWDAIVAAIHDAIGEFDAVAVLERRQINRTGCALLLLLRGAAKGFLKLRQSPAAGLATEAYALQAIAAAQPLYFISPHFIACGQQDDWEWLLMSALSKPHHIPSAPNLSAVCADIRLALRNLERPAQVPPAWRPMHGDLAPWNLRQAADGQLLLYDWERAGWGPEGADEVLYQTAAYTVRAARRSDVAQLREKWPEACRYWAARLSTHVPTDRTEAVLLGTQLRLLDPDAVRVGQEAR